jgi:hypothetical protein
VIFFGGGGEVHLIFIRIQSSDPEERTTRKHNAVFLFSDLLVISFVRHLRNSDIRSRVTDKINEDISTATRVCAHMQ